MIKNSVSRSIYFMGEMGWLNILAAGNLPVAPNYNNTLQAPDHTERSYDEHGYVVQNYEQGQCKLIHLLHLIMD